MRSPNARSACPGFRWSPIAAGIASGLGGCAERAGDGAWWFAGFAFAVVAAGAYAFGAYAARRRLQAEARRLRGDAERAAALADGWRWSTDAAHGVLRAAPPPFGVLGEAPLGPDPARALWDWFDDDEASEALRVRLGARLAFDGLRLRDRAHGACWRLRAVPRCDDEGRFAGFDGSLVAIDEGGRVERQALPALVAALAAPVVVVQRERDRPALLAANVAACTWFGLAPGSTLAWNALEPKLPAPIAAALGAPALPERELEHAGWRLLSFAIDGERSGALLLGPAADRDEGEREGAAFGYAVSHDLRAPIRVVEGFARILKEDYGPQLDRIGNDHLDRVLAAAARMNLMTDALLTLARLSQQPLARQPVNLSQLAGYVIDDLQRAAPERQVEVEIEPGLLAQGDPMLLRLVLENLLGNAWKYSARRQRARIVFASATHEGRPAYVVRDNGAGFDMRSADRLFGLFQRLHGANEFPGTGVGLASVRRIVRRHGGEIWAEGEPGRGAAFHFTLPG